MLMRKNKYVYSWDEVPIVVDIPYVAWVLGVTPETVRKECQRGNLKAFKVGEMWRIRKDDLIAYTMRKQNNTESEDDNNAN